MEGSHNIGLGCPQEGRCLHEKLRKEWDPVFSKERKFDEDWSHMETIRKSRSTINQGITPFFEESEIIVPSCIKKEVISFCKNADVNALKFGTSDENQAEKQRASAWLDDRSRYHLEDCECLKDHRYDENSGCVRKYENPLSAAALYSVLQNKV
jgi:hypothetical protein